MTTVAFTLQRPAALCAAVSFGHLLALACAVLSLSGLPLALTAAGIVLSGVAQLRALQQQTGRTIRCLADGGLELAGATGRATLTGGAVLAPWLAVLQWRHSDGRRDALILTSDRIDAEAFRRLRVWLLWHRLPESASSD